MTVLISSNAFAGDKIDQSLKVTSEGTLFIKVTRGLVKIKGWDKKEISVQGELDDSVKEFIFKSKGDETLIKAESKGEKHWGDSSVLKVFMPFQSKLYFKGINTTFTVSSLTGGIKGKTISGDLIADKIGDDIALSSMGGHIKILNSTGKVKLETVGGDIIIDGNYQVANINSMAGSITLDIDTSDNVKAKTISGDLVVQGDVKNNATIKLISVSGDISYQASENLDAECSLSSQFGGEIINKLTNDVVKSSKMNSKNLSFISGDGSGSLMMHTVSGDITINKGLQP